MERWAEPGAAKQLVFQCRDGEEVGSYRHLLAYVHSHGRELPQGECSQARSGQRVAAAG